MNSRDLDAEGRLQAQAELAERQQLPPGGDPQVDRYRLVMRALRQPLALSLPANFAAQVATRVAAPEDSHKLEDWLVTVLLLAMAVAGILFVEPVMAEIVGRLHYSLPTLPWPLLGVAAVSVAVAWALDVSASGWWRVGHRR
jgi:hypothetical protein